MVKKRKDIIIAVVFVLSTTILFINNLTRFFDIYNINVNINLIAWLGIGLSIIWWMYLFGKKNKMW